MATATATPLLELEALSVATHGVCLVAGLDLSLQRGEIVALAAPSGAGKTTLLRAVCGLIDPASGAIRLEGQAPEQVGWATFRRRVMLVNQQPVLLGDTVRANLERPFAYQANGNASFDASRALALLERLQIASHRLDQDARSLSVGQQQRVCLARALLLGPEVLLLDEPTSALDADAARATEDLLRETADESGTAMLVVSHDRAAIERWCDRTVDLAPLLREHPIPCEETAEATE